VQAKIAKCCQAKSKTQPKAPGATPSQRWYFGNSPDGDRKSSQNNNYDKDSPPPQASRITDDDDLDQEEANRTALQKPAQQGVEINQQR